MGRHKTSGTWLQRTWSLLLALAAGCPSSPAAGTAVTASADHRDDVRASRPDTSRFVPVSPSRVRHPEDVQRSRAAHGHARLSNIVNRLGVYRSAAREALSLHSFGAVNISGKGGDGKEEDHMLITEESVRDDSARGQLAGDVAGQNAASDAARDGLSGEGTSGGGISRGHPAPGEQSGGSRSSRDVVPVTHRGELSLSRRGGDDRGRERDRTGTRGRLHSRHRTHARVTIEGSGNQGIGDGSNVSLSGEASPDELNTGARTFVLHQGTAFSAHPKPVRLLTDRGEIRIAGGAAVYVVAHGRSVAVYNIADRRSGDVTVKTRGQKTVTLNTGEQLVLSGKESSSFDKANPAPEIHAGKTKELGADAETRIFNAEFSPTAALDHSQRFPDLVNSKSKADQALVSHIFKTAAIVLTLRQSSQ